jgi:hypothetical protein
MRVFNKMKTFKLGTKVIVSSRKCGDFGKVGRVVGIKKDHNAPVQRLYVKFNGQNNASVFRRKV